MNTRGDRKVRFMTRTTFTNNFPTRPELVFFFFQTSFVIPERNIIYCTRVMDINTFLL